MQHVSVVNELTLSNPLGEFYIRTMRLTVIKKYGLRRSQGLQKKKNKGDTWYFEILQPNLLLITLSTTIKSPLSTNSPNPLLPTSNRFILPIRLLPSTKIL